MNTAKTVFFSLILSFWLPLLPVLAETPVDPGKLKASSDKFVDTIFSETDKIPTKEAYLCAYKHFENIPNGLKKILAEKGVTAGFDSMPKAQKEKYKAEEKNLLTGAFKCAMDDMIGNLAGKMADKAAAPLRLKANDSAAKADIYNVRLACLDFWKNNGDDKNCSLADAKKNGYVPFKDVAVTVMNGLKKDFAAVGKHNKSDTEWKIGISKQFFMKTKDSGQFTKPPPEKPGKRKANSIAKSQLHNLFLACKAFWADEGGNNKCTLEVAGSNAYSFVLFPYVDVKVLNFQEKTFEAYAHTKNSDGFPWKVKSDGSIVLFLPESETADSLEKKHKDSDYLDPLQLAVTAGRKDLVKDLLKKGYDPAKFNRYGDSSLHMAVKSQGAKRKPVDMKMIALLAQPPSCGACDRTGLGRSVSSRPAPPHCAADG